MSYDIIRSIAKIQLSSTYECDNYVYENISILLKSSKLFVDNIDLLNTELLYNILDNDRVNYDDIFKIITSFKSDDTVLNLLYHRDFSYNTTVLSLLLIRSLNNTNIYDLCCCTKTPFVFTQKTKVFKAILMQLKEYYIYVYNENVRCKCFRNSISKDFYTLLEEHLFGFDVILFLDSLKKLILIFEEMLIYYKVYYDNEDEFDSLDCKNQQEHQIYYDNFESFKKQYKNSIEPFKTNYKMIKPLNNFENIIKNIFGNLVLD
jgi:hypothetical protein